MTCNIPSSPYTTLLCVELNVYILYLMKESQLAMCTKVLGWYNFYSKGQINNKQGVHSTHTEFKGAQLWHLAVFDQQV